MKSIIIGSNSSGGGKTTFTLGLMKALKNRNYTVQGYKVGPDYIDPAFHKEVTGIASRNLDVYLMGEDGVKYSFIKGNGDVGIIEGVMGLYDGIGAGENASTYHVSKILDDMPIILVITPKGQSSTICAEIKGMKEYRNANIAGIVINSVSEKYYKLLKYTIEKNCNIQVFGYVPKNNDITLESRHLGLVQSMEVLDIEKKLDICGEMIEKYVDVDAILSSMKEFNIVDKETAYQNRLENKGFRIGVALDKAFSFYYKDNIELLEKLGEVIYFSPLKDKSIPKNLDFLYIGGGYPEVFKKELEENESMRISIRNALNAGLRCYAECGGLMYLTEEIDGSSMVGFFKGKSFMTKRLQRFGYCNLSIEDKGYFDRNIKINAHEFHKSDVDVNEKTIYEIEKHQYDGEIIKWKCGYVKNNTLAGYAHINFLGNIDFLKGLVQYDKI
ncbi:MAG: cobyrinate a,c-diamide synthase [Clostridium sp.]